MRSKLGTKSRLAAHISAFVLLILMLVYVAPPQIKPDQGESQTPAAQPTPPTEPIVAEQREEPAKAEPQMAALQPERTDVPAASVAVIASTPANPVATLEKAGEAASEGIPVGELRPPSAEADTQFASAPESAPLFVSSPEPAAETPPETPGDVEPAVVASAASAVGEAAPTPETPIDPVEHVEPVEPAAEPETPAVEPAEETPSADAAETPAEPVEVEPAETTPVPESESESETTGGDVPSGDSTDPITAIGPETSVEPLGSAEPSELPDPADAPEEGAEPTAPEEERTDEEEKGEAVVSEPEIVAEQPAAEQPDESGALVVAAPEEDSQAAAASSPLPNAANLEVLDDGVYWLDSRHDLEKELASVSDLGTLILLAPLPGYRGPDVEAGATEMIPAAAADLTEDAAARFLHLTANSPRPVVVAALPGAHGAAFFKGAYLLVNRNLDAGEMLAEIEGELNEAGTAREEIEHRLMRLDPAALR